MSDDTPKIGRPLAGVPPGTTDPGATWKALRQSEEKLFKAFRAIPDSMLISTLADGCILEVNDRFEQQFGYRRGEVIGRTGIELDLWVEPEDRAMMTRLLRERGMVRNLEFEMTSRFGEKRLTLLSGEILELDGETCLLMVLRDITDLRKLEERLARVRRMESIAALTSSVARDLDHVLRPIWTTIEALRQAPLETKYEPFMAQIEDGVKRGIEMARQILTFTGSAGGHRTTSFRLVPLLEDVERLILGVCKPRVEVRFEVDEAPWPVIGDAGQVHQALLQLCDNARRAIEGRGGEGGVLEVAVQNLWMDRFYARRHPEAHEGPYVVITISDTGSGMPAEIVERLFAPADFSGIMKEADGEADGVGLGLVLAAAIIKGHSGFLAAYSEPGTGTNLQVYLPASVSPKAGAEKRPELPAGQGECVLVVDDDASIRDILRETLLAFDYRVLTASSGVEAVEIYAGHRSEIDLVVLDMVMPIMGGEATVRELASIDPQVLVVAVSGLMKKEKARQIEHVSTFIEKPYTAERLLKVLREVLTA